MTNILNTLFSVHTTAGAVRALDRTLKRLAAVEKLNVRLADQLDTAITNLAERRYAAIDEATKARRVHDKIADILGVNPETGDNA